MKKAWLVFPVIAGLLILFTVVTAADKPTKETAKTTSKAVLKDYTIDTLKADIEKTKKLYTEVCADTAQVKAELKEAKKDVEVLKDNQSTWFEKIGAIVGLVTILLSLYEVFARWWKTAKDISIVRRIIALIPNRTKDGGTHD